MARQPSADGEEQLAEDDPVTFVSMVRVWQGLRGCWAASVGRGVPAVLPTGNGWHLGQRPDKKAKAGRWEGRERGPEGRELLSAGLTSVPAGHCTRCWPRLLHVRTHCLTCEWHSICGHAWAVILYAIVICMLKQPAQPCSALLLMQVAQRAEMRLRYTFVPQPGPPGAAALWRATLLWGEDRPLAMGVGANKGLAMQKAARLVIPKLADLGLVPQRVSSVQQELAATPAGPPPGLQPGAQPGVLQSNLSGQPAAPPGALQRNLSGQPGTAPGMLQRNLSGQPIAPSVHIAAAGPVGVPGMQQPQPRPMQQHHHPQQQHHPQPPSAPGTAPGQGPAFGGGHGRGRGGGHPPAAPGLPQQQHHHQQQPFGGGFHTQQQQLLEQQQAVPRIHWGNALNKLHDHFPRATNSVVYDAPVEEDG